MQADFRAYRSKDLPRVREIFFASSNRKAFTDEAAREKFAELWLGLYLREYRDFFWVAEAGGECVGYLTGCPESEAALPHFAGAVPSFALFRDLFPAFPAHLHVNVDPKARSLQVGSELIRLFRSQVAAGIHIITSPASRNRGFYLRNGFTSEVERSLGAEKFLFMGAIH